MYIDSDKINSILVSRKTGCYYLGDIERDITDTLEYTSEAISLSENLKENTSEILAQLPEEDFLSDIKAELNYLLNGKHAKSDILVSLKKLLSDIDDIEKTQHNATEYAYSVAKVGGVSPVRMKV